MSLLSGSKRTIKQAIRGFAQRLGGWWHVRRTLDGPEADQPARGSVLVVGIYLADQPHHATHLVERYNDSRFFSVTQAWVALGGEPDSTLLDAVTVERIAGRIPKFIILNRLLLDYDLSRYDFVIVSDDDVTLPRGFLDAFLRYQVQYDLALAQPARTPWSHTDHRFVLQRRGIVARLTRFVEIGPVFSMRRDCVPMLVPFDEASPMGWGYDLVWPCKVADAGLRLGIVDATPIDHSLRRQGATYQHAPEMAAMRGFLDRNRHLDPADAQVVLERYR